MPLKLENAAKRVGNRWVFRDVSLEVPDGEIFSIFGPAGSGNSEILRSFGTAVANEPAGSFLKRLSGGIVSPSERADSLADSIDAAKGPLLLVDPLAGLDSIRKVVIAGKLKKTASERNVPIVFSTSDFDDVLLTADRAAAFIDGYVRQIAAPRELYEEPATRAVAALTGKHNLIEARRLSSSKADVPEFQTIQGEHRLFTQRVDLRTLGPINQNAWLAIRPEQISMSFGASFPEDNLLKAIIADVQFRGPVTYVGLDCNGLRLEAMVTRLIGLNVGDECMAALPPDRIRVLSD